MVAEYLVIIENADKAEFGFTYYEVPKMLCGIVLCDDEEPTALGQSASLLDKVSYLLAPVGRGPIAPYCCPSAQRRAIVL